ncbi:MAG: HAD family hydrolase [Myxococcota bacterium]
MPIRAVVFDLFDTLVDLRAEDLSTERFEGRTIPASARQTHALVAEGHAVDFAAFQQAMLDGMHALHESHLAHDREVTTFERMRDALARLGIDDDALAERMSSAHMGVLKSVVRAPDHHASVLDALRERVRVGLCSNFSHSQTAHQVLAEAGFDARLDAVVVSDAFGLRKPRREIFLETTGRLGVAPEETLHVGDSLRADVGGGAAAGLRTVWITRRVRDPEKSLAEHQGPAPDHRVADLAELLPLLDALA